MEQRPFGKLGSVSALTLGGGGLGQIWGATTREECVAVIREAADSGVTLLDLAPSYGNGEAESVIGEAFGGALPDGVRVTTKCRLGNAPPERAYDLLSASLDASLERMRLPRVDIMLLHNMIALHGPGDERTTPAVALPAIATAFRRLVEEGRIGAWGLTGIGEPRALFSVLTDGPRPDFIQCITNLLDSPGGLHRFEGPARPRDVIADANAKRVSVMGIRAAQAGALTDAIDRPLPDGHPERLNYDRAAPFRAIAAEVGLSAARLAHQYALSMKGVATVVLGVKNRNELRECLAAEADGPLDPALAARIDAAVGRER